MKTNQNMVRQLGEFEVIQRTKDGMFNATYLLNQWNESQNSKDGNSRLKEMGDFTRIKATKEFIEAIKDEDDKDGNSVLLQSRGRYGGTWMHPYLFIDFAMWLNPRFKLQVIKFVHDQLVEHRHDAGDYYRELCSKLTRFGNIDYSEVGKILNYVVFNTHEPAIRNKATPEQEDDLQQLERDMCQYIDHGFVESYEDFKSVMRKEWKKRHAKVPLELKG